MARKKNKAVDPQKEAAANRTAGKKPDIHMLDVATLQPHPQQGSLVGDMPLAEFEALVADIEVNGIQNPLIVMSDGTMIVCGHQRHRAARQLGFETVACIVRRDLHDPDDPAVMKLLLSDNLRRRQLSSLEKARYTHKLFEIELGRRIEPEFSLDFQRQVAVRDAVGKLLGCSGRNAARYLAVLNTPPAVQEAFGAGMLSLVLTASVAFLRPDAREKLAGSIGKLLDRSEGKGAKKAKQQIKTLVEAALNKSRRPKPVVIPSPVRVLRNIKDCLEVNLKETEENYEAILSDLRGDDIDPTMEPEYVTLLKQLGCKLVPDLRVQSISLSALVDRLEENLAPILQGPQDESESAAIE